MHFGKGTRIHKAIPRAVGAMSATTLSASARLQRCSRHHALKRPQNSLGPERLELPMPGFGVRGTDARGLSNCLKILALPTRYYQITSESVGFEGIGFGIRSWGDLYLLKVRSGPCHNPQSINTCVRPLYERRSAPLLQCGFAQQVPRRFLPPDS